MKKNNPITIDGEPIRNLRAWLVKEANENGLPYLLAHAVDGVIWGRFEDGLTLSGEAFDQVFVKLRPFTLQQARLFGPAGELHLWRNEDGLHSHLILDGQETPDDAYEELHWLWGEGISIDDTKGFSLMEEGQQGLYHAVPKIIEEGASAALQVRHYIDHDIQGQAYVTSSRLVDLVEV